MSGLVVFNVTGGADTGGQGIRIKQAFDRYAPGWEYRTMASANGYIRYPRDLPVARRLEREHWKRADVVHLRNNFAVYDRNGPKPAVVHYHGRIFRADPNHAIREQRERGAVGLVSTLDLWLLAPEDTEWLPAPYEVDWLKSLRRPHGTDRIVIAHAPTDREVKSTAQFLDAVARLQRDYPVDLEFIENRPWSECLERKARADIFFDQAILGYGCNAIEAWGMGIPVVAGAADETLDEMERRFGHLPFYHATEDTIFDALRELVESPKLRAKYSQIGHDYVRKYHDEPVVVEQLKRIYQRAVGNEMEEAA